MKKFTVTEVREAVQHAREGVQALHLHRIIVDESRAPQCFVRAVRAGKDIAHLFDQDAERLKRTVRRLGVRIVVVEREGTDNQHVDLCGKPLELAKLLCE